MRLYDYPPSGNGYKVRLLLAHLGVRYVYTPLDLLQGDTKAEWFRRKNPQGRVPVLELDDGELLAESNAILCWLAHDTEYWPRDALAAARVLQWMFFEQNSFMPFVGGARFLSSIKKVEPTHENRARLAQWRARGRAALQVMEGHLAQRDFLAADRYTIADIALYAYAHVAREGGFDLTPLPAVRAWLSRVAAQPGHVRIDSLPATIRAASEQ